ncbi:hypothetical protein Q4512_16035 [Oceanihabitans sp. 2_MG-2023]|uniref:hypothetical protein n=1 Tax=Oceanihabitans sp. 2_MG-2023 TaxID=3062661 RepID=UPI0026E231E2|nr:hypothetical protein [Oceanihabitans sp. 2_MG-2023]MDO6598429.1 hypothetical protein [Oceanihabitans sp. 2_MG-2023]
MKPNHLFCITIAILLCFSCKNKKTNANSGFDFPLEDYTQNNQQQSNNIQNTNYTNSTNWQHKSQKINNNQQQKKTNKNGLKPYKIISPQFGILFGILPIPKSWNEKSKNQENILFENASGVKVYGEQYFSFSHHNDPQRNQFSKQNGANVQPLKSLDRVINEDFKPYFQKEGASFVRQYPLPHLAQKDKLMDSYIFKATPENKQYQCMVTEWKDQKGNLSVVIVRYYVTQYPQIGGMGWGYTINALEAPKKVYENAKQNLIYALINLQINPQWVKTNNQYYAQMAQKNNTEHQARMAAIKATGRTIRQNAKTYSDMADSRHESWKKRNAISDAGHANTINSIWERSTMTNTTGDIYQVEGYNNNVWKNANDTYLGTDDYNYNPNIDNTANHESWEQLEHVTN